MNLRELNYILIPRSAETWERFERSRVARPLRPLLEVARSLTTEGQVVLVAMLIAGAAGIDVRFSHLYLVFCGLLGLLVAGFVCRPLAALPGVTLRVEHPPRVAAGEVVTFTLVLRNDGPRPVHAVRLRGPFLPWDGSWEGERPSVPALEPGAEARVTIAARFLCRGQRALGRFRAVSVRPLGLFAGRRVESPRVVITVVPRVPAVGALHLPRRARSPSGRAAFASLAGESFELLGVRPYRSGDRIRDLHARSWARVGEPIVREYRQEFFVRAGVILWPAAPGTPRDVFDAAVELAAGLVARLAAEEALVDLVVGGNPPAQVRLGPRAGSIGTALDLLALAVPGLGTRADCQAAAAAVAEATARTTALCVVAVGWSAELAALVGALRAGGAAVAPFVIARKGAGGEEVAAARNAGARVLRPGAHEGVEVRFS